MKFLTEQQDQSLWIVEKDLQEGVQLPKGVIMQARGKFAHAGRITSNGRLYTRKWYQKEIARVTKSGLLETGGMIGETDHPSPTRGGPSIRQNAFIVRGLEINEQGEVMGRIDVMGTQAGEDLAVQIRAGAQIGFSSRARGEVTAKRMNDQHPDWSLNKDWDGREFDEVNDDASLQTYDSVNGPAIGDAHVADYNEDENPEEEEMEIKLDDVLKNEALMKGVLESDAVKAVVEKAVETAKSEAQAEFEKNLPEMVSKYMESDAFADKMRERLSAEEEELDEEEELEEAKCPECEGVVPKNSKFCPACGVKMAAPAPKAETKEEADKVISDLVQRLEKVEKENSELKAKVDKQEQEKKDAETKESVEEQVDQLLENCAEHLAGRVRLRLKDKDLTEAEDLEKTVNEVIEEEKAHIISLGGEQLLEKGKPTGGNTGDLDEQDKGKKQQNRSVTLTKNLVS